VPTSEQDHRIVVTGRAERRGKPDRVEWSISVEAVDPDERAAFGRCSSQASERLTALREVSGEGAEIATAWVRVAPQWDSDRSR
jgi:uncharacterized protein YggE